MKPIEKQNHHPTAGLSLGLELRFYFGCRLMERRVLIFLNRCHSNMFGMIAMKQSFLA